MTGGCLLSLSFCSFSFCFSFSLADLDLSFFFLTLHSSPDEVNKDLDEEKWTSTFPLTDDEVDSVADILGRVDGSAGASARVAASCLSTSPLSS